MVRMKGKLKDLTVYLVLTLYSLLTGLPILWSILNSFKHKVDFSNYSKMFLFNFTLDNYSRLFQIRAFGQYFGNSIVVVLVTTALTVPLSFVTAYALARWPYRGKGALTLFMLALRMLPPIALTLPIFMFFRSVQLTNSLVGLILVYIAFGLPFGTIILKGYLEGVPRSFEESARVDGCGRTKALFLVVLPACAPGVGAATLFVALSTWSEFLFAMILTGGSSAQTAPVATAGLISAMGIEWGPLLAASTLLIVPMVIFVFMAQKALIEGLSSGLK